MANVLLITLSHSHECEHEWKPATIGYSVHRTVFVTSPNVKSGQNLKKVSNVPYKWSQRELYSHSTGITSCCCWDSFYEIFTHIQHFWVWKCTVCKMSKLKCANSCNVIQNVEFNKTLLHPNAYDSVMIHWICSCFLSHSSYYWCRSIFGSFIFNNFHDNRVSIGRTITKCCEGNWRHWKFYRMCFTKATC